MGVDSLNCPPTNTEAQKLYFEVVTILDSSILPAFSYLDCNCCMAEEIWTVVKVLPYHFRYSVYARWKNETFMAHPQLIRRRGNAQKQIKSLMKHVSKENVKPVGRLLFDYILFQIQIYDNLIGPVLDSLKYLTSLSYDMLAYCLIESLGLADRDRFKHDGTSISFLFFLARPMFSHQINQTYDQLRKADPNAKKLITNQKLRKYLEATTAIISPIVESVCPLKLKRLSVAVADSKESIFCDITYSVTSCTENEATRYGRWTWECIV